ncbi:MAG: response regulator [Cyanobacteria bacterium P01_F01_bin.150]
MEVFIGPGIDVPKRSPSPSPSTGPLSRTPQSLPSPTLSPAAAGTNPPTAVSSPSLTKSTGYFLVVDDNVDNRDMLERRLTRKGHTVMTVASGEAALNVLDPNSPNYRPVDMVLLDVMMPGMDGIETLSRIRQTYSQLQLPVIMVTAKDSNQDMLQAFDLGANDYITKPIDFDVALARIQNQLLTVKAVRSQVIQQAAPPITHASPTLSSPALPIDPAPSPPPPISFRPPAPMAEMQRDRLNGRYQVVQVLTKDIFSQLLIAKDMQQPEQPLYFLKKIYLTRLPLNTNTNISKDQAVEFLNQEIGRLQAISPNASISTLVTSFIQDDAFFTVQNFVDGDLLTTYFQTHGPLSFTQTVPLFKEIFSMVDFIHRNQIIHGEIHAHHLVRRRADDRLILIDLGLTQRVLNYLTPNAVAEIGFIQGYMPPEQCEGQLLFSSDVYALGMLILQALTGKTPEYINRDVVTGELKWRELTDVDDKTANVIRKMVCQNYAERYAYPEQASKDLLFQWYTLRFKRSLS